MSDRGPDRKLPERVARQFFQAVIEEIGDYSLRLMLRDAGLEIRWDAHLAQGLRASEYAGIQAAIRAYFGNGARGVLNRIGRTTWQHLIQDGSLLQRAHQGVLRALPGSLRARKTLDFLAARLAEPDGQVSAHLIDRDLILMDQSSDATYGQQASDPVCWATLGMVQAALFWATRAEQDVEEISCRAIGADACRFRVRSG